MRRALQIGLFAATVMGSVYAQDAPAPAPLPQAMQSAIDRIAKGSAAGQHAVVFPQRVLNGVPVPAEMICSVPLREMQVISPGRFSMRSVPPPGTGDPMPRTNGPAPPCAQAVPSQNR